MDKCGGLIDYLALVNFDYGDRTRESWQELAASKSIAVKPRLTVPEALPAARCSAV